MTLEDLTQYQNAGLAASLYQSEKSKRFVPGALELTFMEDGE